MKIKEVKCPNCNANIKLKENSVRGKCEYCQTEIILDDEKIKIEHNATINFNDDNSLEIANVTLNKFQDYEKSLFLYQQLLYKYAHKEEVYIGLIRSITHDFTLKTFSYHQINEINSYWQKYITLAKNSEIAQYENAIKDLNKNYWYNLLINKTNDFNAQKQGDKVANLEKYYNNYLNYCEKKEKDKLESKYKTYIKEYTLFIKKINEKRKKIIRIIIYVILSFILITTLFLVTENTKQTTKSLKLSEFNEHYYVIQNDYQYFEKYFKDTVSKMKITKIELDNKDKTINMTVLLKNILFDKEKVYKFAVIDDTGPIITPKQCEFMDTENINLYECFSLYDFTDGVISLEKATINTENIDFKKDGTKIITVTATDKDGHKNELKINVIINKTPIDLQLNVTNKMIVGKTYDISYNITPNNISNKEVTYTFDNNLFKINNGKVKALKKGQGEICAVSKYDNNKRQCQNINLELQCQNTYSFKFDGNKKETITANEVFCPGTYRIYASVMNKNEFYRLEIKPKGENIGNTMLIYKNSSFLSDEGKKYNLTDGYTITTDIGVKEIRLVK